MYSDMPSKKIMYTITGINNVGNIFSPIFIQKLRHNFAN